MFTEGGELLLDTLLSLDGAVLLWIQEVIRSEILNPLVAFYTQLGNGGMIWIVLSVVMLCFRKTRRAGALSLLAMLLGLLFTNVAIKHLVGRSRPWLTVEGLRFLVVEKDPNSFPSGHTCAAFASAGVCSGRCPGAGCGGLPWPWRYSWAFPGCMLGSISPLTSSRGAWWACSAPGWPGPFIRRLRSAGAPSAGWMREKILST